MKPLTTYNAQGLEVKPGDIVSLTNYRMKSNLVYLGVGLDGRFNFVTTDERKLFVALSPDRLNWTTEEAA